MWRTVTVYKDQLERDHQNEFKFDKITSAVVDHNQLSVSQAFDGYSYQQIIIDFNYSCSNNIVCGGSSEVLPDTPEEVTVGDEHDRVYFWK